MSLYLFMYSKKWIWGYVVHGLVSRMTVVCAGGYFHNVCKRLRPENPSGSVWFLLTTTQVRRSETDLDVPVPQMILPYFAQLIVTLSSVMSFFNLR